MHRKEKRRCRGKRAYFLDFNAERTNLRKKICSGISHKEISLEDSQEDYSRIAVRARACARPALIKRRVYEDMAFLSFFLPLVSPSRGRRTEREKERENERERQRGRETEGRERRAR